MSSPAAEKDAARLLAPGQYLSFVLGSTLYGIEILRVQEIRGYTPITPLPKAPDHIKGVLSLRGDVVAVVDLRVRLGLPPAECTKQSVVVIVRCGRRLVGLVVDAVSDVVDVSPGDLVPEDDLGEAAAGALVTGVAKTKDGLLPLLALDVVIGREVEGAFTDVEVAALL